MEDKILNEIVKKAYKAILERMWTAGKWEV